MKKPRDPKTPQPGKKRPYDSSTEDTRCLTLHGIFMPLLRDKRRKYPSYEELHQITGIKVRTLQRTVELMRDQWKMPVGFVPERDGIGYSEPVTHFPLLTLSETQVAVLAFAQQLMSLFKDTPFFDAFKDVMKKAIANTNADFAEVFAQFEEAVSFHTIGYAAPAEPDPALIAQLIRSVVNREVLEVEHKGAKRDSKTKRVPIYPRHLANVNHAWYLWFDEPGAKRKPGEPRKKYALTRIRNVRHTGRIFQPPAPFNIHDELRPGLGAYNEKETHPVHIRFSPDAAPFILERKWHDTRCVTENPDGTVDVRMNVCLTPELDNLILPWAGNVDVLSPQPLRDHLRKLAEALVKALS